MALTMPTTDTSRTTEDLGVFSTGSIYQAAISGYADGHLYASSVQAGGLPAGLTVTGASLATHVPEAPRNEFKVSLGVCGQDLAAQLVALRRLGFIIIVTVVQTGLTHYTSNGKVFEKRLGMLVRPQDVGQTTVACGMGDHRITATAAMMPALTKLLFIDPQEQIDQALAELPALIQKTWETYMPGDLKNLCPLVSPSAACIYAAGVNLKTGTPIQKPDRDNAPLALRLLKSMGLLTTIDLDTFKWTQNLDVTSLAASAEDHSYSAMRQWEAEHLGALDGSGTFGNLAQNFVDHNWGSPLGSTGAAFQPP